MASPKRKSGWYTPTEVSQHNNREDCWVMLLGYVYDLTPIFSNHPDFLCKPILLEAGGDISHWFDDATWDLKSFMDPIKHVLVFDIPQGRFIHVPPNGPRNDWNANYQFPWWKDPQYVIGKLSKKTRLVRIKNVLIDQEILLEVPSEENINEIIDRYLSFNAHATSYTWKALCQTPNDKFLDVDMNKTLQDNGVPDQSEEFVALGLASYYYIPVIHIYYNDDLTVA